MCVFCSCGGLIVISVQMRGVHVMGCSKTEASLFLASVKCYIAASDRHKVSSHLWHTRPPAEVPCAVCCRITLFLMPQMSQDLEDPLCTIHVQCANSSNESRKSSSSCCFFFFKVPNLRPNFLSVNYDLYELPPSLFTTGQVNMQKLVPLCIRWP